MTNAELIDLFRKVERADYPVCCKCPITNACDDALGGCLFGCAADLIEAQQARIAELEAQLSKKGEWISVEDRLPQPRELVLVARKDGFVSLGYCFQFGENHLWSAIRLVPFSPYELPFVGAGHITQWMPLPDAPEGEQE